MDNLQLKQVPVTKTGMLIRKPVADVFEAFVNPDITTKFWFTKGSGRLEVGKQVQWDWEMYGISIFVTAKAIEPNKRIVIEWPGYGSPTTVEWIFAQGNRSIKSRIRGIYIQDFKQIAPIPTGLQSLGLNASFQCRFLL